VDLSMLAHIAPIHHSHINLRGIFPFPLNQYRAVLLDQPGDKIVRVGGGRK
jgi:hypothetical protein